MIDRGPPSRKSNGGALRRAQIIAALARWPDEPQSEGDLYMRGGLHKGMGRNQLGTALQRLKREGFVEMHRRAGLPSLWGLTELGKKGAAANGDA